MKKQFPIVGITVLLIAVGLSGCTETQPAPPEKMIIGFVRDNYNATLTVNSIHEDHSDLMWSDIILEGNATLPSGSIDIGDVITNCDGKINLSLRYDSRIVWLGVYYVKNISGEYDKFVGTWIAREILENETEGEPVTYHFCNNRTFTRNQISGTYEILYENFYFGQSTAIRLSDLSTTTHTYVFEEDGNTFTLTDIDTGTMRIFTKQ